LHMIKDYDLMLSAYEEEKNPLKKARKGKLIADKLWSNGEYQKCRDLCDECLALLEFTDDLSADPDLEFDILTTIGISYNVQGNHLKARDIFDKALTIGKEKNNYQLILKSYINIGNSDYYLMNYESALDLYFNAVMISEQQKTYSMLPKLYNNIGNVLMALTNYDEALDYFKKSLHEKMKTQNKADIANSMANIANVYTKKQDFIQALSYYKGALKLFKEENCIHNISFVYINLAEIYLYKKEYAKAVRYLLQSLEINKQIDNQKNLYHTYNTLGRVYFDIQDLESAEKCFDIILKNKEELQDKKIYLSFLYNYACLQIAKGNSKLALQYLDEYETMNYQVFNEDMAAQIASMRTKFDYEQKQNEVDLYRIRNIELLEAKNQIEQQKEELIQLNQSKDAILNIVSHDLKNTLGSIVTSIDLLANEVNDEGTNRFLDIIKDSSEKAIKLVKDILEANRIEMVNYQLDLEYFNISDVILSYRIQFQNIVALKRIKLIFETSKEALNCKINIDKFWQILHNVFSNAVKYSYFDGEVFIRTSKVFENGEPYALIEVEDQGVGIPQNMIPVLFEKFSPASRKGTAGEGSTGLGLSIVKRLVELHNGFVRVSSVEKKGTTFMIYLPLTYY